MEKEYAILYTHQKQKKAKTWHDGTLKHSGHGTQAVLFDDKGGRLDSIHIKVADVVVGEQLESDRYYILVEELKKPAGHATIQAHNPEMVKSQTESQESSQRSLSQARCAGLKRKKSGFMPPRMLKQQHKEVTNTMPQSDDGALQWNTNMARRLHSTGTSHHHGHLDGNQKNLDLRSRYQSCPDNPDEYQNIDHSVSVVHKKTFEKPNHTTLTDVTASTKTADPFAGRINKNMLNLYSRFGKGDSITNKDNSSQDSDSSNDSARVISPWSVYGSANSSPAFGLPKALNRESVASFNKYEDETSVSATRDLGDFEEPGHISKSSVFSPIDQSRHLHSLANTRIKGNETKEKAAVSCKPLSISQENEYTETTKDGNKDLVNNVASELKPKRSMIEIMSLLRRNPTLENLNPFQDKQNNSIDKQRETPVNDNNKKAIEVFAKTAKDLSGEVKKFEGTKTVICSIEKGDTVFSDQLRNKYSEDLEDYSISFNEESLSGRNEQTHEILHAEDNNGEAEFESNNSADSSLGVRENEGNTLSGAEKLKVKEDGENVYYDSQNEELVGSFGISFSPLSHTTDSDNNEIECEEKIAIKSHALDLSLEGDARNKSENDHSSLKAHIVDVSSNTRSTHDEFNHMEKDSKVHVELKRNGEMSDLHTSLNLQKCETNESTLIYCTQDRDEEACLKYERLELNGDKINMKDTNDVSGDIISEIDNDYSHLEKYKASTETNTGHQNVNSANLKTNEEVEANKTNSQDETLNVIKRKVIDSSEIEQLVCDVGGNGMKEIKHASIRELEDSNNACVVKVNDRISSTECSDGIKQIDDKGGTYFDNSQGSRTTQSQDTMEFSGDTFYGDSQSMTAPYGINKFCEKSDQFQLPLLGSFVVDETLVAERSPHIQKRHQRCGNNLLGNRKFDRLRMDNSSSGKVDKFAGSNILNKHQLEDKSFAYQETDESLFCDNLSENKTHASECHVLDRNQLVDSWEIKNTDTRSAGYKLPPSHHTTDMLDTITVDGVEQNNHVIDDVDKHKNSDRDPIHEWGENDHLLGSSLKESPLHHSVNGNNYQCSDHKMANPKSGLRTELLRPRQGIVDDGFNFPSGSGKHLTSKSLDRMKLGLQLDNLTSQDMSENTEGEDPLSRLQMSPLGNLPHPSQLFGRSRNRGKQQANDLDLWGREKSEEMQAPITAGMRNLPQSVNSKLSGYRISGSVCSVASRITPEIIKSCPHPSVQRSPDIYLPVTPGNQCNRTQSVKGHKSWTGPQCSLQHSPSQRLSDSDLSACSSPSFYVDWNNEKPQLKERNKRNLHVVDSPLLRVPETAVNPSWKRQQAHNVFISQSGSSDGASPGNQHSSTDRLTMKPEDDHDDDEIYTQLYKPRMMYRTEVLNNASRKHILQQDHSLDQGRLQDVPQDDDLCSNPENRDNMTGVLQRCDEAISCDLQDCIKHRQKDEFRQNPFEKRRYCSNVDQNKNQFSPETSQEIFISQGLDSSIVISQGLDSSIETVGSENSALGKTIGKVPDIRKTNQDLFPAENDYGQEIRNYRQNCSAWDSQSSGDCFVPVRNCKEEVIVTEEYNDQSCDSAKDIEQLGNTALDEIEDEPSIACKGVDSRLDEHGDSLKDLDSEIEAAKTDQNSKWGRYIPSQNSEDNDIDLNTFTQKIPTMRKDFTVIEKPVGFFTQSTQLTQLQRPIQLNSLQQKKVADINEKKAGFSKSCGYSQNKGCHFDGIDKSCEDKKDDYFRTTEETENLITTSSWPQSSVEIIKKDGIIKTPNSFSSNDSFEELLANDDFEMDIFPKQTQSVGCVDEKYGTSDHTEKGVEIQVDKSSGQSNKDVTFVSKEDGLESSQSNAESGIKPEEENRGLADKTVLHKDGSYTVKNIKTETLNGCSRQLPKVDSNEERVEDVANIDVLETESSVNDIVNKLPIGKREAIVNDKNDFEHVTLDMSQTSQISFGSYDIGSHSEYLDSKNGDNWNTSKEKCQDFGDDLGNANLGRMESSANANSRGAFKSEFKLNENDSQESSHEIGLNDSLNLSFSVEDFGSTNSIVKTYQNITHHSLRIGWKPPVNSSEKNLTSSNDKPYTSNDVAHKLKPTFKCLRLLSKAKLAKETPDEDNKYLKERIDMSGTSDVQSSDCQKGRTSEQTRWTFHSSQSPKVQLQNKLNHSPVVNQSVTQNMFQCDLKNQSSPSISNGGLLEKHGQLLDGPSADRNKTPSMAPVKSVYSSPNNVSSAVIAESTRLGTRQSLNVTNKRFKPPMMMKVATPAMKKFTTHTDIQTTCAVTRGQSQGVSSCELRFPSKSDIDCIQSVARQVFIPETFPSINVYKQILTSAMTEYINTQLYDVAKRFHHALLKVDTTGYMASSTGSIKSTGDSSNPACQCGAPSKMVMVRKEGPNNGRHFYACSANRKQQCKYFQWADEKTKGAYNVAGAKRKIADSYSLSLYLKNHRVNLYGDCHLAQRTRENIKPYFKAQKWVRGRGDGETLQKKQMFLKLPHKGRSSMYAKDDIWIISQHMDFDPSCTFLARSTYFGPTSANEVEIEPLVGYSPSNWPSDVACHAILAGNASSELSCIENIREHIQSQSQSPPVIPHLLSRPSDVELIDNSSKGFQTPRTVPQTCRNIHIHSEQMDELVREYIEEYNLNTDQSEAIRRVANMFSVEKTDIVDSVLLIHGVFGAGKSFLLSVIVLFLIKAFQLNDSASPGDPFPWKLLISSTTNVAVDRILMGLLDLGFEDFVRVGSMKKIAKPVLPYSVHASGTDSQELKDLQEMLRSGELTNTEKSQVRQSIEKHRHGENKKKLGRVRVVGATCASCSLFCLNNMQFPLVLLDECSQMTEPASLLPVARFACHKLILVGDPKQLDPTIHGAEVAHSSGLEQTLFDRLIKMGCLPTILRTQYRCHPCISGVANTLFYGGMLVDGVTEKDRQPLLQDVLFVVLFTDCAFSMFQRILPETKEILPTICHFDVSRGEECCEGAGSYYNEREAQFVVFLLQVLLHSGIEPTSVGVITLYRSQMSRIMDLLTGQGDQIEMKGVQVSTVDAFQGGERDVIILSCVRTHACGFIDNDKRTNVALTRARHHLLIVGNLNNLSGNLLWGKVISYCRGYPNGIQSADEARHNLEHYLETIKLSGPSVASKGLNSDASKGHNSDAQNLDKIVKSRKRKGGRKRRLSENDTVSSPDCSNIENSTKNCEGKLSEKKNLIKKKRTSMQRENLDSSSCSEDELFEHQNVKSLKKKRKKSILKEVTTDCDNSGSAPVSLSASSGHSQDDSCNLVQSLPVLYDHTTDPSNKQSQSKSRSRHADKLHPDLFDSEHEDSEDDLPAFNCGES